MEEQLKSSKYLVYEPVIPAYDSRYITYDLPLIGLDSIRTFSTRLESTAQVFAYGHDLFLARIFPDNKYDMIDEEFNYGLLFLVIFALFVANYFGQKFITGQTNERQFLLH